METIAYLRKQPIFKELNKLVGAKVVKVIPFVKSDFDSGYHLQLSNGKYLSAQDGEYGDNALEVKEKHEL